MTQELVCISCIRKTTNMDGTVVFSCPQCKEKIVRCGHCRSIAAKYACPGCKFTGPN